MLSGTKTVAFVTGTRAEWGLMQSTILRLTKSPRVRVRILVTGMHTQRRFGYTLRDVRKAVHVDHVVRIGEHDDQLTAFAKEVDGISRYLKNYRPDALLLVGDRDEPFAGAVAGLHLGIPLIHVAGGDVTGPTVDHYLRNAMTLFAGLHLVQTKRSRTNVLRLGAEPDSVHVVGAPGLDQLTARSLPKRNALAARYKLNPESRWILVVMHPTILDNVSPRKQINAVLSALKKLPARDEKIILYPNADDGNAMFIAAIEMLKGKRHYRLQRHFPRMEYLGMMNESAVLVGNTSSGLMEAGHLHTPFVSVGNRQRDREYGSNVIFAPYHADTIAKAIRKAWSPAFRKAARHASPYRGGAVANRIVKAIEHFVQTL